MCGALHDVSNAMTVVVGWLEAAEAQLPDGPARDAVAIARTHAGIGHAVARRAIGADPPVSARYEINREAHSVVRDATLGVALEAAKVGVAVQIADNRVDNCAVCSPVAVQQILTNLLLNAIAFSPEGGLVSVEVFGDGQEVLFVVSDHGSGIPEERRATIFDGQGSTRSGGAGVGLAHSAQMARHHGGVLALGASPCGARFELRWPGGEVRSATRQRSIPSASLAGRSILVVEDDPAIVSLLEIALESRGARVVAAHSAAELEHVVALQRYDAALVDLSPIGADPAGWVQRIKADRPQLPLVMITGTAFAVPGLNAEVALTWVRKPFEVHEVLDALTANE